jgi:exodeoxyribonuclease V gamma subunit
MLQLHFSNRHEALTQLLLGNLYAGAGDAFEPVQVIVPSRAVERSLTLAIADATGVCANVRFEFLARWLWRQIGRLVPGVGDDSPFEPETLTWRIWGVLGDPQFLAPHARLAAWLRDGDALLRYELACRLAALVRDYSTYRDDWLEAWAQGRSIAGLEPGARATEAWQAELYRRIVAGGHIQSRHPGTAFVEALARLDAGAARAAGLPRRLHLFALPTLPPQHLRLLVALSAVVEVHLYVLNPCQEYWFELVDRRRLSYLALRGRDQYHEEGNRLLAAWGRQAQSHIELLVQQDSATVADDCHFAPNPAGTLLAQLQNSILELTEPGPATLALAAGDRSIEVHDCHSLGRELEVLHDALLDLFAGDDGTLRPSDVLVAVPDLEAAAPLIEAVFGTVPAARAIPFQMTGRSRSTVNAPARTLLALLSLAASRCPAPAVFDLLQQRGVARRFDLDDEGLQQVRDWMQVSGMRWALDAAHAAACAEPPLSRHTLADGLERLFLGFALPEGSTDLAWDGLLPAGNAAGSDALALGAFCSFITRLASLQRAVVVPQSPERWRECLVAALGDFIAADADELDDLNELQLTLDGLADAMRAGGIDGEVPLAVVQSALAAALDAAAHGGVPTGRVTFTSLASLRGLPFEVICVLGLDDGAFPTSARAAEFDLLAQHPRRGDRQRAPDERNLFLDLVLAARRRLYLSYSGRGVRDNAPLNPSVLIAELLETLGPDLAARLLVRHPLQPFAREAFARDADPRLRSYDTDLGEALRLADAAAAAMPDADAAAGDIDAGDIDAGDLAADDDTGDDDVDDAVAAAAMRLQPPFFTAPLPPLPPGGQVVTLDELAGFLANPSRYLLRRRLGLQLRREDEELPDTEPFTLESRDETALAARLLPTLIRDPADRSAAALLAGGIETPGGSIGEFICARQLQGLRGFAARVHAQLQGEPVPAAEALIDSPIDGERWQVSAVLQELRTTGLVRWSYARPPEFAPLRAADALRAWLWHLALCAAAPPAVARRTVAIGRSAGWQFAAPADPCGLLADLVAIYREGLRAPLPFFPRAAWALVSSGGDWKRARAEWRVTTHHPYAESGDAAHRLVFRGLAEPLDRRFEELARRVFGPLCAHVVAAT